MAQSALRSPRLIPRTSQEIAHPVGWLSSGTDFATPDIDGVAST
jgi:hypothetical protein